MKGPAKQPMQDTHYRCLAKPGYTPLLLLLLSTHVFFLCTNELS
jgi:hypothetical protein